MAVRGQRIESPPTGQEIEFLDTAADTGGELLRVRVTVAPGGRVPLHVHPEQEESFVVERGRPSFRAGPRSVEGEPGTRVAVPPGTPHLFRNGTDAEAVMIAELRPALRSEEVFESLYHLAREGRTRGRLGVPGPRDTGRLMAEYRREFFYLARVPIRLQRVATLLAR